MASTWPADTTGCRSAGSPRLAHSVSANLTLKASTGGCQRVYGDILIDMHSLGVLSKVVKAREPPRAMTLEWTLPGVFASQGSALSRTQEERFSGPSERTYRICLARCSLRVKLRLHGG